MLNLPPAGSQKKGWPWEVEASMLKEQDEQPSLPPRVTIVTPSYNQGCFLEETIRSVLLQNYNNIEYIIIDGGSTDETREIIEKYSDWITYWVSEADGGQANAINKGWSVATGEFVTWLNSDDILFPNAVNVAVRKLSENPRIGIVYGDVIVRSENAWTRDIPYVIKGRPFRIGEIKRCWVNPIPQPGFLMRKEVMTRIGKLDETMQFSFDLDYWVRAATNRVELCYIPVTLAQFRMHYKSKSYKDKVARIKDSYYILTKINDIKYKSRLITNLYDIGYFCSAAIDMARTDLKEPNATINTVKQIISLLKPNCTRELSLMMLVTYSVGCLKLWTRFIRNMGWSSIRIKRYIMRSLQNI